MVLLIGEEICGVVALRRIMHGMIAKMVDVIGCDSMEWHDI